MKAYALSEEPIQLLRMARLRLTGYPLACVRNGNGISAVLTDAPYATMEGMAIVMEDIATHMQCVLENTYPRLKFQTEPIRPVRPSQGFTVVGSTPDECVVELHVRPIENGFVIEPFTGNGDAAGFLGVYKQVLEREVVVPQA